MDADKLRALQAPIKERYGLTPRPDSSRSTALSIPRGVVCKVETGRALALAGLHRRQAEAAPSFARAICCSKPWSRALA